jgi:hypothetical protein
MYTDINVNTYICSLIFRVLVEFIVKNRDGNGDVWPRGGVTGEPAVGGEDGEVREERGVRTVTVLSDKEGGAITIPINSGRVGLENLGNTCYMNSSLQALLHTEPLAEYFLSQAHHRDLNVLNRFGYGGRLAGAFGQLAHELWTTNKRLYICNIFIAMLMCIYVFSYEFIQTHQLKVYI